MCADSQQPDEHEPMRQLLLGIVGACPDLKDNPEAEDYDFLVPHRFTPAHRRGLSDFGELAARMITVSLRQVLGPATQVTLSDISEEYAEYQKTEGRCFKIAIIVDERIMGWLELPSPTALAWITQLLGGVLDDTINQERNLSALESDLLVDVSKRLFEAVSTASQESDGPAVGFQPDVQSAPIDLDIEEDSIEFCRLKFQSSSSDVKLSFSLVFFSTILESIAGLIRPEKKSPEEVRIEMQDHIEKVTMSVKVRLDKVNVPLREIASLAHGDVLLLNTRINEPIDVIVSGNKIMKGLPVQHAGYYGVHVQAQAEGK